MRYLITVYALLFLSGCATSSMMENNRDKALVLLSENSAGLLAVTLSPAAYYCRFNKWPTQDQLTIDPQTFFHFIRLQYEPISTEKMGINFDLKSEIENDVFLSHWQVTVSAPNPLVNLPQPIELSLNEKDLNIHLIHTVSIDCVIARNYDPLLNPISMELL